MSEKFDIQPRKNPDEVLTSMSESFGKIDGSKQRDGDLEITRAGDRHSSTIGARLFKAGKKTVVESELSLKKGSARFDVEDYRVVKAKTNTSNEEAGGTQTSYDAWHSTRVRSEPDSGYFNVWDTVSPGYTTTTHENAQTDIVRKKGKEVYTFTSKSPELADKVASIAARKIMGVTRERLDREKDLSEVIGEVDDALPDLARILTPRHKLDDGQNIQTAIRNATYNISYSNPDKAVEIEQTIRRSRALRDNPDDPRHHAEKWHQHGIVTHSREFAKAIKETIPDIIDGWGILEEADDVLSERIDGAEKRQLLEVASLLHDVGKFTARLEEHDHDSDDISYSYAEHEEHSGRLIRPQKANYYTVGPINVINEKLKRLGLTSDQIEYVARCAELHFELGKVRRASKENGGYTMAFVDTSAFHDAAQEIIDQNQGFALEIGLMFIADSLSKSEVAATGNTDEEIEVERPHLEMELHDKGLNPKLINQALQMPVNLKVAQTYLKQWAQTQFA